mmetsp:Transcript_24053/g.51134  ORF Transcript_24053/g.51134 Transcript_24053/m.51134 type:complete len:257 (-) Transcript_24053:175-945(-)
MPFISYKACKIQSLQQNKDGNVGPVRSGVRVACVSGFCEKSAKALPDFSRPSCGVFSHTGGSLGSAPPAPLLPLSLPSRLPLPPSRSGNNPSIAVAFRRSIPGRSGTPAAPLSTGSVSPPGASKKTNSWRRLSKTCGGGTAREKLPRRSSWSSMYEEPSSSSSRRRSSSQHEPPARRSRVRARQPMASRKRPTTTPTSIGVRGETCWCSRLVAATTASTAAPTTPPMVFGDLLLVAVVAVIVNRTAPNRTEPNRTE